MKFKKEKFLSSMRSGERVIVFNLPYDPLTNSFHSLKDNLKFEIELHENKNIGVTALNYPYIYGGQYQVIYKSEYSSYEVIKMIAKILSNQEFY